MSTRPTDYDVVVIGAGVNGAGIARDAALRGLRVLLLDKGDIAAGTSWASSRLIHGGLRYLEYGELPLVLESLAERRRLLENAPHLVRPLKLCIPVYRSGWRGGLRIRLGLVLYDLLSWVSGGDSLPRHRMLSGKRLLALEPGINPHGLASAATYYDAQVTYVERLVLENVLAARQDGADVRLHSEVVSATIEHGAIRALDCVDRLTGERFRPSARVVVNAAGPWVDEVLGRSGGGVPRLIGGTKGSHVVVRAFTGSPDAAFYVEAKADGRPIFILPWNGLYLIGTTDIRYDGDLDRLRASADEVDYLLTETNRVFPEARLGPADVCYAYAGVRPLPWSEGGPVSAITRRHIIRENDDVARGLVSIIGGKLTTYRELAEQTVDVVGRRLGLELPACTTRTRPLPGAGGLEAARAALADIPVLAASADRLLSVYGARAAAIARLAAAEPSLARLVGNGSRISAAEIAFAIREELPRTLIDVVFRRTMLGLEADQGRSLYEPIASVAASEFGWSTAETTAGLEKLRAFADSLREVDPRPS